MRELFQLDPQLIFLNHGSFGACPRAVTLAQMEANPVAFLSRRSGVLLQQARAALGIYLGADPDDLAFIPNATTGVNIVARSLQLQPGDEILATDHEYGACDATFRFACERTGAAYKRVEIPLPFDAEGFTDRLMAAVTPRTRLIFLSHITSATALIFPVERVCAAARAQGILTLVDGAHAPGQINLNLTEIGADFYTGNGHKWMCGPKGSAFLHARREHHDLLHAPVVSWGYVAEALDAATPGLADHSAQASPRLTAAFDAYAGIGALQRRLQWQGTRDVSAWLALPSAMAFQAEHDWDCVRQRSHRMAVETMHALCKRFDWAPIASDGDWGQMAAIPVPHQDAAGLQRRLFEESRIEVPVTQHQGQCFVRVSVQGYVTEADLQALLEAPALQT